MALGTSFCTIWQFICNLIAYGKLSSYLLVGYYTYFSYYLLSSCNMNHMILKRTNNEKHTQESSKCNKTFSSSLN